MELGCSKPSYIDIITTENDKYDTNRRAQSLLSHLPHILTERTQPDVEGTTRKHSPTRPVNAVNVHTSTYV